jgi:hypothetical protein
MGARRRRPKDRSHGATETRRGNWESAIGLAHTLESHTFVVECVRSSKQAQIFDGQKGAAW